VAVNEMRPALRSLRLSGQHSGWVLRLRDRATGFVWFFIWTSLIGIPVALLATFVWYRVAISDHAPIEVGSGHRSVFEPTAHERPPDPQSVIPQPEKGFEPYRPQLKIAPTQLKLWKSIICNPGGDWNVAGCRDMPMDGDNVRSLEKRGSERCTIKTAQMIQSGHQPVQFASGLEERPPASPAKGS
jgi:hypothetical protein